MAVFLIFRNHCQKTILLADIFQLQKYQVPAFTNVSNERKKQQDSGKFRLGKLLLYNKILLKFNYIAKI